MLHIEHLTKHYDGFVALNDLSLQVPEGIIFGLLGPNGAGKTTLLRILTGLIPVTSGTVSLFGNPDPTALEVRRLIGYMPQAQALYPGLTVSENIRFFGRLYGVAEAAMSQRLEYVLDMVDLLHKRNTQVAHLSGGMVRRAMLASTLIHQPRLLILDEPTAGVDPSLRLRFWGWFERLVAQGTSIIITTHHISEAKVSNQVVFLRDGRILEQGQPATLMHRFGTDDLEQAFVRATEQGTQTGVLPKEAP